MIEFTKWKFLTFIWTWHVPGIRDDIDVAQSMIGLHRATTLNIGGASGPYSPKWIYAHVRELHSTSRDVTLPNAVTKSWTPLECDVFIERPLKCRLQQRYFLSDILFLTSSLESLPCTSHLVISASFGKQMYTKCSPLLHLHTTNRRAYRGRVVTQPNKSQLLT